MRDRFVTSTALLITAFIGTCAGWAFTNMFLLKVTLFQFFIIEVVISIFHALYNKAKRNLNLIK